MAGTTVGPRSWLDDIQSQLGMQDLQPIIDTVEQMRQQAMGAVQQPVVPTVRSSLPQLSTLIGPSQEQPQAPAAPQQATAPEPKGFAAGIPGLDTLLGLGQQQQPQQTDQSRADTKPSATPVAPAQPSSGHQVAASGQPSAMPQASAAAPSSGPAPQSDNAPQASGDIDNSSRASFVKTAYPYMLQAAGGDKNLAELMLAKAISENGDVGKGGGFIGNNFSGIKGEGSAGSFEADTWEDYGNGRVNIRDKFAAFKTPVEGFNAFMGFLRDNSRYAPALAAYQKTGDADQLIRDIHAAGYATDPIWPDKIENIRRNQVAPVVRGADDIIQKTSDTMPADEPALSPGEQKRQKMAAASGQDQPLRNRAVAAWPNDLQEWRATGETGEGTYSDGTPRNTAVAAQSDEMTEQANGRIKSSPTGRMATQEYPFVQDDESKRPTSYRQPLAQHMGPDTATGDDQASAYNDPTDGGTLSQPLPSQTDSAAQYGASGDEQGTESVPLASRDVPVSSPADDPGGAQFAAQDAYSTPATAEIPSKPGYTPILDTAHNVIAWIQDTASGAADTIAAAGSDVPSVDEQAQRASVAGRAPDEHLFEPARVVAGTAPPVQSTQGEPDYVPRTPNPVAQNIGLDASHRMRQIEANAAAAQGIKDPIQAMRAPTDPTWRAENPEMAQEYDDLQNQLGLIVVGQTGDVPHLGRGPQTVEALQQRLQQARSIVDRLLGSGDTERLAMAQENRAAIESALVDAQNARRALEPRIRSDVGAKESAIPPSAETIENRMESVRPVERGPMAPEDLSGPVSIPTDTGSRLNVEAGPSAGSQAATAAGNAIRGAMVGGVEGAMTDPGSPQGEDESDADYAARRAREVMQRVGTHALVGGAAFAAGGALLPRAGGALQMAGPQGQGGPLQNLPGVQRAIAASQQRAARMAANPKGPQALEPLQWMGELVKSVGYSSMIGLRTATMNLVGNVGEPVAAGFRETSRALTPQILGGRGHPSEALAWLKGNAKGAMNVPSEARDAILARGHYASNPDQPSLSERTINPIAHAAALLPELGGRVFSGLPDAIFGSLARGAGEEMSATRIANDLGLTGHVRDAHVAQTLADTKAILGGAPPSDAARLANAQQALRDGQSYSNDMTYRNKPGDIGKGLERAARLGASSEVPSSGAGVIGSMVGNLTTPFFTTPHNMNLRMLERTPAGFAMNTVNRPGTMRTNFDRNYDATVGSAILAGLVLGPAASGYMTGSGPDDPEERKMLEQTGWRAYSTLLPGNDGKWYYVPNRNIANYGPVLNAIGEYHDSLVYRKKDAPIGEDMAKRVGRLVQDTPYASGLTELVGVLKDPYQASSGYAASIASRLMPYGATQRDMATSQDTVERQSPSVKDAGWVAATVGRAKSAVGQGGDNPPKTDVSGQSVPNSQRGVWALLPKFSEYKNDPIITELLSKNTDLGQPRKAFPVTVAGADAPDGGVGTRQVKLSSQEQQQWQQYRWQALQESLIPLMKDPDFRSQPVSIQQRTERALMVAANKTADGMIRADWGDTWDAKVAGAAP